MSNENHHEELDPKTREYFYGENDGVVPPTVPPELLIVPEDPEEIKQKISEIKAELEKTFENKTKHSLNNNNKGYDKIEEDALPFDVKKAEEAYEILQQQKKVLEEALHKKIPPSSGIKGKLLSLFGLLP